MLFILRGRLDSMSVKIQCVKRKRNGERQWYVSLPADLARTLEIGQGEEVDWQVSDANHLVFCRKKEAEPVVKTKKKATEAYSVSFRDFLKLLGV
jgi:phosphate uptake regulator